MTVHVDLHVFMRDQRWVFIDNNLDRSIGRSGQRGNERNEILHSHQNEIITINRILI